MDNGADVELKRRAERRIAVLDQIEEAKSELKLFKDEDKADGYSEKALGAAIKSMRKGPEWHAEQLMFELEVDTYRKACGLTTDAEEAQKIALDAVSAAPGGDGEPVGDSPDVYADTGARGKSKRERLQ